MTIHIDLFTFFACYGFVALEVFFAGLMAAAHIDFEILGVAAVVGLAWPLAVPLSVYDSLK